jgi:peptidoglycan/LPS O-acetylase OafA/YrhL
MSGLSQRLIGVDLARILAAWMVLFYHLAFWSWAGTDGTAYSILHGAFAYPELKPFSSFGWVGVQIFFVISGLVISSSAEGATAADFARRRFLRLFPGALVSASLTLAVAVAIEWKPVEELVTRYVRSVLFAPIGPWIDGAYWTLGIEISFYTLIAALLLLRRQDKIEHVTLGIGACSAIYLAANHFSAPWGDRKTELLLLQHGVYFALGCTIWFALQQGWTRRRILSCASLGAVCVLPLDSHAAIVWTTVITAMIVMLHFGEYLAVQFRAITPAIKWLSLATYPLYLTHTVIGATAMLKLAEAGANRFVALLSACVLMLAISLCLTAGPERLLRNSLAWAASASLRSRRQFRSRNGVPASRQASETGGVQPVEHPPAGQSGVPAPAGKY